MPEQAGSRAGVLACRGGAGGSGEGGRHRWATAGLQLPVGHSCCLSGELFSSAAVLGHVEDTLRGQTCWLLS